MLWRFLAEPYIFRGSSADEVEHRRNASPKDAEISGENACTAFITSKGGAKRNTM